MFDGVPHTYGIGRADERVLQEIAGSDGDTNDFARINRRVAGQIDAAHAVESRFRQVQKETVCRADFEQKLAVLRRQIAQQRCEAETELLGKQPALGNVIALLFTLKIGFTVKPLQFLARQGNVRGHKSAPAALEQAADLGGAVSAPANLAFAVNRHWPLAFLATVDQNSCERMPRTYRDRAARGGATVKRAAWSIHCS